MQTSMDFSKYWKLTEILHIQIKLKNFTFYIHTHMLENVRKLESATFFFTYNSKLQLQSC